MGFIGIYLPDAVAVLKTLITLTCTIESRHAVTDKQFSIVRVSGLLVKADKKTAGKRPKFIKTTNLSAVCLTIGK